VTQVVKQLQLLPQARTEPVFTWKEKEDVRGREEERRNEGGERGERFIITGSLAEKNFLGQKTRFPTSILTYSYMIFGEHN
jgi:hypothetical protein